MPNLQKDEHKIWTYILISRLSLCISVIGCQDRAVQVLGKFGEGLESYLE